MRKSRSTDTNIILVHYLHTYTAQANVLVKRGKSTHFLLKTELMMSQESALNFPSLIDCIRIFWEGKQSQKIMEKKNQLEVRKF